MSFHFNKKKKNVSTKRSLHKKELSREASVEQLAGRKSKKSATHTKKTRSRENTKDEVAAEPDERPEQVQRKKEKTTDTTGTKSDPKIDTPAKTLDGQSDAKDSSHTPLTSTPSSAPTNKARTHATKTGRDIMSIHKKVRRRSSSSGIDQIEEEIKGMHSKAMMSAEDEKELQRQLTHNSWYHGLMPRDEIEDLLTADGDFLVRKTSVGGKARYAVSVMNSGRIRHILLKYSRGDWWLKDLRKNSLIDLITAHVDTKAPVQADGTLLVKAVHRPDYYILHEHVEIGKKLGGGAFGEVFVGRLKNKEDENEHIDVAIKKLKNSVTKKQRSEFVKEAKLMRRLSHPNIIQVIGVAAQEEPILILLELALGGLSSKLKKHPDLSKDTLMTYTVDACRGMTYLAGRKVIHRDIAARNCLLGKNDCVKISDFGLSVADQNKLQLHVLRNVPIKWLAPEVFSKGLFSTKSDVWAFGVLIWEIWSYCKSDPFPDQSNAQAKAKQPMDPPEGATEVIKAVMSMCFTQDPEERPYFPDIFRELSPAEAQSSTYIKL